MRITISYENGSQFRNASSFLPFLKLINKYPFPKPKNCTYTNHKLKWFNNSITSFTDEKLLKHLQPIRRNNTIHYVIVDETAESQLQLVICQKSDSVMVLSNLLPFLALQQIRQFFLELIHAGQLLDNGWCGSSRAAFMEKNFPNEDSDDRTMLTWLQYYGKAELEKRGGYAAFESNPYVQTQRIHDGLLVQVGESPDVFETPEGEQLLVRAIHALPLIKH